MIEMDVLIIGGGSAGENAARTAVREAGSVGLVEKSRVGGACVFNACIPTKALVHAARTYKKMRSAGFYGLPAIDRAPDYRLVKGFKDRLIEGIASGRDESMAKRGVTVLEGAARFVSSREVAVADEIIRAHSIVIATGSAPAVPPIPGLDDTGYLTHIDALELESIPDRMAVIGGGPVGVEFIQVFSAFGSDIDIYDAMDRIMSVEDEEISSALGELLRGQGISISTSVRILDIKRTSAGKLITLEDSNGVKRTAEYDEILVATGRRPVVEGLDLAAAGIETYTRGIKVDSTLRTSVPYIWAAGDVTGMLYFTYIANEQGKIAALNAATSGHTEFKYDILPRATFCDPEVASVGLTETQARETGRRVVTGRYKFADMTRPIVSNETDGFIKIVAEEGTGLILGGHILGAEASTTIHEIAAAMAGHLTVFDIGNLIHSYPTFSEGVRYACQTARA
ncbi:MAG: NAD(P)/FAD-dependent oxidoreductase [Dehalococcoidia bacterium]|nr:NAD(P)/FAD-dependent oxidoreductase [Dehalococcoidia bacterium]